MTLWLQARRCIQINRSTTVQWAWRRRVTPNGYVALACDLFCGRTSENEACLACAPAFAKIPHKYALMYDKGVAKLQVHLENMNQVCMMHEYLVSTPPCSPNSCPSRPSSQVITPCFLRKLKRFSVAQGCRNRGITSNRYIAELPFARAKQWAFLGGISKAEDAHLLNSVWWWSLGFQNLVCKDLKPPKL